jgi:hypothetical protein
VDDGKNAERKGRKNVSKALKAFLKNGQLTFHGKN